MFSKLTEDEEDFYDIEIDNITENDEKSQKDISKGITSLGSNIYTIYYTRKIQMKMSPRQRKFIFAQLELSQNLKRDVINIIFEYLIKVSKTWAHNPLYKKFLNEILHYRTGLAHQLQQDFKVLYYTQYKQLGIISSNFQDMTLSICNQVNSAIIKLKKIKISQLPYYSIFRGREMMPVNKFCITKSFSKNSEDQYLDSLHIRLPYLKWIRLKDREGYFTRDDWNRCYKIFVKREASRTYLIFSCKMKSDDPVESWSAKIKSPFRRNHHYKYTVPLARSIIKVDRIDPRDKIWKHNLPADRFVSKENYDQSKMIEDARGGTFLAITRDFSWNVVYFRLSEPRTNYQFLLNSWFPIVNHQLDVKSYDTSAQFPSFNANADKHLLSLIDRYNHIYRLMIAEMQENLQKKGYNPAHYHIPKYIDNWKNTVFDDVYNSKKMQRYRVLQKKIMWKIHNKMIAIADRAVRQAILTLPQFIIVKMEPYPRIANTSSVISASDISGSIAGLCFDRLVSKARLLQIPVFLINEDYQIPNTWDNCVLCGKPLKHLSIPSLPAMEFNSFQYCTNPNCEFHKMQRGINRPLLMGMAGLNVANLFINTCDPEVRKQIIELEALPRFYGSFNKYRTPLNTNLPNTFPIEYRQILNAKTPLTEDILQ